MRTDISPTESLTTVNCFPPGDGRDGIRTAVGAGLEKRRKKRTLTWRKSKSVAAAFGYTPEDIDQLYQEGFTPEELEDALYGRELW